jgi:hypothetical protein
MVKKQHVNDCDDDGKPRDAWLWQCDECGKKAIKPKEIIPKGWEVEDEDDLENTRAVCPTCTSYLDVS